MMWDIGGVFFMGMKQPVSGLARPAGDQWIIDESSGVSDRGQAHRDSSTAVHRPSRNTGGQAPRDSPKSLHRPSRKAEDPVRLDKTGRSVARTGPSLEVGAWIAAAMLRGRARGAFRAVAACPRGAAPVLGRVVGVPVEEAVVVEATVAEVEVMVVEATVAGVVAVKA